ncbi:MAG: DUF4340 domain-containing protein [Cyclobacteriaceae bacterium]|nr:DUF4340 domain-containing protein [Cyclobacteriaceae bacterium]
MKENRNLYLLISLIAMSLITAFVLIWNGSDSADIDKSLFKIAADNKVDKIQFESAKGKVELTFNGSKWLLNKQKEADAQMVTVFFASLLQAEPKRELTGTFRDSIQQRMKQSGIRVKLWEGDVIVKEMTVVGNEQKTETYFQLPNEEPYFVTIPGYRVYVASIFELTANEWRDKRIFNFNWQNFKSLKSHLPSDSAQDFTVSLGNGLFGIEEVAVTDTTKLSQYLESIFNLRADRFLTSEEIQQNDSLLAGKPVMELTIQDIAKHQLHLSVFGKQKEGFGMVATINQEPILLRREALAGVLRKRSYFAMKP